MDLRPQTAEVIRGGQTMQLPIEQVQVGDLVIVRGGQSVPVDGEITEAAPIWTKAPSPARACRSKSMSAIP